MRKYFTSIIIGLLLLFPLVSHAQVTVLGYTPFAYEILTADAVTPISLNATYKTTAGAVFITVETKDIRYRIDNGNPSATVGHLVSVAAFQNLWFNDPSSIKWFKAIGIGGSSTLHITYYRR